MGMSSNVVVRLSRSIPRHINHIMFFDNFFTSEQLMIYLHKEGIQAIGTVRQNRVKDHGLIGKAFAKTSRGTFETRSCTKEGVELHLVQWNDTRVVTTLSNYLGAEPTTPIQRYNRRTKTHVVVKRPLCIGQYNEGMGGVDLMDSLLGYYKISLKTKKWYMRVFFHCLDMITVNAWLLKRREEEDDVEANWSSFLFRTILAEQLMGTNQNPRGFASNPGSPTGH